MTKTERQKLIAVVKQFDIPLPKKKYVKNEELKNIIIKYLDTTKPSTPQNITQKGVYTMNIKKSCFPKSKKLVAIGDIHGDLSVAIKSLKLAGVIDISTPNNSKTIDSINWTGGDTVVVQLGDQIDRVRPFKLVNELCSNNDKHLNDDEGSDLKIICLFEKLHEQAIKTGGALFSILGNHELMNVDGDFRYVSPKEFKEFGVFFDETENKTTNMPYGYETRKRVFAPGGSLSKKLANSRYSVLQVGSWVFAHGGLTSEISQRYTLDHINLIIQKWLQGNTSTLLAEHVNNIVHNEDEDFSPFWTRKYSDLDRWSSDTKKDFFETINILNLKNKRNKNNEIKGMIVGHSPQYMYNKGLNSDCNQRLWRVDVGMSKAFGKDDNKNRKVQILVIENDTKFKILKEQ
jgi:hypothetical protein